MIPIWTIEIDDSQFREFRKTFDEFKKDVDDVPDAWKGTNEQVRAIRESYEKMRKTLQEQNATADEINNKGKKTQDFIEAWMASNLIAVRNSSSVLKSTYSTTKELGKWTKLTAVFTGLLGAGGLFGITRLAQGASDRRRASLGVGVSIGERTSFQTNFGRLGNTDALLGGISEALSDMTKRQPLASLGIGTDKNASETFAEALPKIKNIIDRTDPSNQRNVLSSYGLDKLGVDDRMANVIRRMSNSEIQQIINDYHNNVNKLQIPDDVAKKWQDLQTQFLRAKSNIEKIVGQELVHITPGLTDLSNSLVDLFRVLMGKNGTITNWLHSLDEAMLKLADNLASSNTQDTLSDFVKHLEMTKNDFDVLNTWIAGHQATIRTAFGAAAGAAVGSALGPIGTAVGAAVGGAAAYVGPKLNGHEDNPGATNDFRNRAIQSKKDMNDRARAAGAKSERDAAHPNWDAIDRGLGDPHQPNNDRSSSNVEPPSNLTDRSRRELSGVDAPLAEALIEASKRSGVDFQVNEGRRTQEEADANAIRGVGVRDSQHLYGTAADIVMVDKNGNRLSRDAYERFAEEFDKINQEQGNTKFRWLGHSRTWSHDIVHFDEGLGEGQRKSAAGEIHPYGHASAPTADDIKASNQDAYKSPENPLLRSKLNPDQRSHETIVHDHSGGEVKVEVTKQ